jgi:DNA-binding transcriptional MocR family regulator
MIWPELVAETDSMRIYDVATQHGLSFVPGALFSVDRLRENEMAPNFSFGADLNVGFGVPIARSSPSPF